MGVVENVVLEVSSVSFSVYTKVVYSVPVTLMATAAVSRDGMSQETRQRIIIEGNNLLTHYLLPARKFATMNFRITYPFKAPHYAYHKWG
jgi:hypothetical protein